MKILSSLLLTWAAITVGGLVVMATIVAAVETYTRLGWPGVAVALALVSGLIALPVGLLLRLRE